MAAVVPELPRDRKERCTAIFYLLTEHLHFPTFNYDTLGWKIYWNRPGIPQQKDNKACGLYTILFAVCAIHGLSLKQINKACANALRVKLLLYFCTQPILGPTSLHDGDRSALMEKMNNIPIQTVDLVTSPEKKKHAVPVITQELHNEA